METCHNSLISAPSLKAFSFASARYRANKLWCFKYSFLARLKLYEIITYIGVSGSNINGLQLET